MGRCPRAGSGAPLLSRALLRLVLQVLLNNYCASESVGPGSLSPGRRHLSASEPPAIMMQSSCASVGPGSPGRRHLSASEPPAIMMQSDRDCLKFSRLSVLSGESAQGGVPQSWAAQAPAAAHKRPRPGTAARPGLPARMIKSRAGVTEHDHDDTAIPSSLPSRRRLGCKCHGSNHEFLRCGHRRNGCTSGGLGHAK